MSTAKRLHYGYDDYLSLLEQSSFKLEYCDGVIYAMAGGTPTHAALAAAMIGVLRQAVKPPCLVFSSDLKLRIESSGLSTFPDASVVCGPQQVSARDANALTNPAIVVEVTSRSTEDYDRGDKLSHYKQLASLRVVLFVSHRARAITVVQRTSSGWEEKEVRRSERVDTAEVAFAVDDIYAGIALDLA
jgi:Uma2 family endonuclease